MAISDSILSKANELAAAFKRWEESPCNETAAVIYKLLPPFSGHLADCWAMFVSQDYVNTCKEIKDGN
jgi:hypothetical protein